MTSIVCCGLSPTVQRTLFFDRPVHRGSVTRARTVYTTASGKAANVARMVAQLGGHSHLVQPLAGETGRLVERMLGEDGVLQSVHWLEAGLTRTCTTLLDGETTELVEEAPPLTARDLESIEALLESRLMSSRLLCLSGSFPRGVPEDWFAKWVSRARSAQVATLVDAQQGPLRACLSQRPWLVKPNRAEAIATLGLSHEASATDAVRGLLEAGAENALVTDGPSTAVFGGSAGLFRINPVLLNAVNPIGSGDALAAGIATQWVLTPGRWEETLQTGFATAAANCLTPTSGMVNRADMDRLRPLIEIEILPRTARD